ncbi:MAG: hypothetical protein CVV25_06810 [Ignavibacteriae bacterium HGW-Ignavibacteriae-4]|jgi:transcriptional regulator with XRE-family HTH domain|nr:MAG: hypothetical protein CVV25_06810 [Ignavibacteriae bacterium HGW-Ignavibacteriae-4]
MGRLEESLRLYEMILATGLRKAKFSSVIGMSQQSLNDYLDGTSDIKIISRKLFRKGFSIDWLYSGRGNMYFSPDRFEEQFSLPSIHDINKQKVRIKEWIIINFESLENFQNERNVDVELLDSLYNDDVIQHDLLVKLENAGCNLKWTVTGIEPMYIDNFNGKKLIRKGNK